MLTPVISDKSIERTSKLSNDESCHRCLPGHGVMLGTTVINKLKQRNAHAINISETNVGTLLII